MFSPCFGYLYPLQVPNVTDVGLKPRHIKKVAIIGGGLMGSGIATALLLSNIYVFLKEINSEYLLKGIKLIEGGWLLHSQEFLRLTFLILHGMVDLL